MMLARRVAGSLAIALVMLLLACVPRAVDPDMATELAPSSFLQAIEDYETYLEETRQRLDDADRGSFTPDLRKLDAMMASLEVK
jgi:hypothetical protein